MDTRPLLAITMGDPAGIGPEVIVGSWIDTRLHQMCRAVVFGHPNVLERAVTLLSVPVRVVTTSLDRPEPSDPMTLPCITACGDQAAEVAAGRVDARGGQAAVDALHAATEAALAGRVDGLVTAPLNKAALAASGCPHPGHTELLAQFCGVPRSAMMLYLDHGDLVKGPAGLGVVHTTLHISLRRAIEQLTTERIIATAQLAHPALGRLLESAHVAAQPRLAVCALNPHAGEDGLFGDEEQTIIQPAVEQLLGSGIAIAGPYPADTLMVWATSGEFDGVIAMYHDQGHIALKLLGMTRAVNITLGLPIVRTSVAHGTAFDRAWQGCADTSGMLAAVRTCTRLVRRSPLPCPESPARP